MKSKGIFFMAVLLSGCPGPLQNEPSFSYPTTKKIDLVENLHGLKVADPYRWLEDLDSVDTLDQGSKYSHIFLFRKTFGSPKAKRAAEKNVGL